MGSLPSEIVVAAVAGASARTLLSWIFAQIISVLVFSFFSFAEAAVRGYSVLKVRIGVSKAVCKVLAGCSHCLLSLAGMA